MRDLLTEVPMEQITRKEMVLKLKYGLMLLLAAVSIPGQAQDLPSEQGREAVTFRIAYPINQAVVHRDYMENQANIDSIRACLKSSSGVDSVVISSWSSPEGPGDFNRRLARRRGEAARSYILELLPATEKASVPTIRLNPESENWAGLRALIEEDRSWPLREEALEILDRNPEPDLRKQALRRSPAMWGYILHNYMPRLRFAQWVMVGRKMPETPIECPPEWGAQVRTFGGDTVAASSECCSASFVPLSSATADVGIAASVTAADSTWRKTILAVKTNLLYDAISWLNFAIEVPFAGNRFSVLYEHQFPWWRWGMGDNRFCMRYLQMTGEVRWWFHPRRKPSTRHEIVRDRLSGHFLGLYGMGGRYDFERKCDVCYQGEFWSLGLSYGYSLPIGRRLNLEFSLSAGYASIDYRHFIPADDYSVLYRDPDKVGTWNYFGITKAAISLVFPIGVRRTAGQKGGAL